MSVRLFIFAALCIVAISATTDSSTRPKSCPVGTTYKKDCNTCACSATPKDDKCSNINCARAATAGSTTRAPSNIRPGTCPTIVTPAPGSKVCEKRDNESTCSNDKDCPGAKKCCVDGCNKKLCRNPIYNYTR